MLFAKKVAILTMTSLLVTKQ